jgi:actin-related protein
MNTLTEYYNLYETTDKSIKKIFKTFTPTPEINVESFKDRKGNQLGTETTLIFPLPYNVYDGEEDFEETVSTSRHLKKQLSNKNINTYGDYVDNIQTERKTIINDVIKLIKKNGFTYRDKESDQSYFVYITQKN